MMAVSNGLFAVNTLVEGEQSVVTALNSNRRVSHEKRSPETSCTFKKDLESRISQAALQRYRELAVSDTRFDSVLSSGQKRIGIS